MSQEQPPLRSRRELRKAREQASSPSATGQQSAPSASGQQSAPSATGEQSAATQGPAPEASSPVAKPPAAGRLLQSAPTPEPTHTQRTSQIRARDRAALRTIKELEEKEGQLAGGGAPTRRQLRLQQLKEQTLTAANQIVAPAPGKEEGTGSGAGGNRGTTPGKGRPQGPNATPAPGFAAPEGMSVEQALAARALLAEQAKNQIAKMEHIASLDPEAVDPQILAEQIALAERAAVLNRRAMAKQKLAEQTGTPAPGKDAGVMQPGSAPAQPSPAQPSPAQPGPGQPGPGQQGPVPATGPVQRPAPSAASNLAMVTPLEFVQVPGVDRPVMKPPATSHVPVTTRPGTKVPHPGTRKRAPAGGAPDGSGGSGRSRVIARAEAAARAAARPKYVVLPPTQAEGGSHDGDMPRVPARAAHGLDPLDAATAGLARATRNRILQLGVLALGVLALTVGVILIISGMSR